MESAGQAQGWRGWDRLGWIGEMPNVEGLNVSIYLAFPIADNVSADVMTWAVLVPKAYRRFSKSCRSLRLPSTL